MINLLSKALLVISIIWALTKSGASSIANAEWILSDELIINGYITEPFIKVI